MEMKSFNISNVKFAESQMTTVLVDMDYEINVSSFILVAASQEQGSLFYWNQTTRRTGTEPAQTHEETADDMRVSSKVLTLIGTSVWKL